MKPKLLIVFYLQINSQIEQQNSIIEAYLQIFDKFKWKNLTRLLLMAEFAYNNIKNISFFHILLELNYGYYSKMFYKKDVNPCFKSILIKKLLIKLKKTIIICHKNFCYV